MNRDTDYVLLLLEYGAHPDKLHHKISNHNMYNPKLTSLNAAVDYMLGDDNMYQTVRALLIRGCETENFCLHERYFYGMEQLINLLYNFGVQVNVNYHGLWMKDLAGRYSTSQRVMLLQGTPRSLLSACRIVIISCLPRPRRDLNVLDHLPLPSSLIAYLKFCDV
uniref:SOCS box domain-containing protein n=1 Tax=Arion vulgaris TaxID=1028688 RepID=A0A0B6ZYJ6_9EUPU